MVALSRPLHHEQFRQGRRACASGDGTLHDLRGVRGNRRFLVAGVFPGSAAPTWAVFEVPWPAVSAGSFGGVPSAMMMAFILRSNV